MSSLDQLEHKRSHDFKSELILRLKGDLLSMEEILHHLGWLKPYK